MLLRRLWEIRRRGGVATNTWTAISTVYRQQEVATESPPAAARPPTAPNLVFLVTKNPPTDTVTRPPSSDTHTHVYPIGVGRGVREMDLAPFSYPGRPLLVDSYGNLTTLVRQIVNITHNTHIPRSPTLPPPFQHPTLPPRTTLPPSGKRHTCSRPHGR